MPSITTNISTTSTRWRSEKTIRLFIGPNPRSGRLFAARRPVDEQGATGHHLLARVQALDDLGTVAVDQSELDVPCLHGSVRPRHPDVGAVTLVHDGAHRHARARFALAGHDRVGGKH